MNTQTLSFTMELADVQLPIIANFDGTGIFELYIDDPMIPNGFLRHFFRVRKFDRDGEPREHDLRVVKSKADTDEGTLEFKVELADFYVRIEKLAEASAHYCKRKHLTSVNAETPEVVKHAIQLS